MVIFMLENNRRKRLLPAVSFQPFAYFFSPFIPVFNVNPRIAYGIAAAVGDGQAAVSFETDRRIGMPDDFRIDGNMNRSVRQVKSQEQENVSGNTDLRRRDADAVFRFKRFLQSGHQQAEG